MAGNGGTAVLIAVAIGVSLGLLNQTPTASSTSPTTSSSTASSASSTASSTVAVTASSGSTADVTTGTGPAPTPLASCPGREVGQHTANDLTVRIYYDSQSRGLNCVAAVHLGPVTPPGYLQVEIRIADYTGTSWPRYASKSGDPGAAEVGGAYLVGTDGKCVTGTARYFPSGAAGGSTTSVSLSGIGCA
jgi:hypothetical protein